MQVQLPTITAVPASQRADVSTSIEPLLNPWTIIIDTAEQHPFTFQGIHADSDRKNRLLRFVPGVNLIRQCLGRHPDSLGDYSIEGFVGRCHVERKSMEDAHGTLLGWPDADGSSRRERFESELRNLSNMESGAVIFECTLDHLIDSAPEYDHGKKTAACNAKILERSVLAYAQDYDVKFIFCDGRRRAELRTFQWLNRFWQKHKPKRGLRK
jgi:hypothetical protein